MKPSRLSILVAAAVLAAPLGAYAQNAPQGVTVEATAPGEAVVGHAVQFQGNIKSVDKKERVVVVVGPQGNDVVFHVGEEARNFDQIRVGDLVTLTFTQAVALKLSKVKNTGIRERDESEQTMRAEPGQMPGGVIERTIHMVADVVEVNLKTQTVTLRGAEHTVKMVVEDPAQLKDIKVGNQVDAVYRDTVTLQVSAANK
ncbi:hypothetical protein [Pusillimonas sp. ANT_WB101]|uniref:hypothetical protein n=1 Tax=Pusillimonas sp. ANT_WB101 TaxID=2597356 RepID=UPI0011EE5762|nr:hypothetical protein [Pusillimonas sp. ANT_WB101]KAA0889404.1 hypothetical protein FQ179_19830 [Pusillimonas sp. ANT_WB101]